MAYLDNESDDRYLTARLSEHLSTCPRCGDFFWRYQEFREGLKESFQKTNEELGSPELGFMESGPRVVPPTGRHGFKILIRAAAAAVFALALGFSTFYAINERNRRNTIREEAVRFANALFSQPLFSEGTADDGDLFAGPDILLELVLPLPQNGDFPDA
jgi:hypothetical protein